MNTLPASRVDGLDLNFSIIDKELIGMAKKSGLEVLAWTVDDPAEAKRLIGLGITGITTNKPDWLKSAVSGM
jgi:glycerophosphoryl diester phosphodiesterase